MSEDKYRDERERRERKISDVCRSVITGQIGSRGAEATLRSLEHRLRNLRRAERRASRKQDRDGPPQLGLDLRGPIPKAGLIPGSKRE